MTTYDTLGAVSQLGVDLNQHESGELTINPPSDVQGSGPLTSWYWDSPMPSNPATRGELSASINEPPFQHVDMCVHQGKLHVIWVELEDNGAGDHFVKGPYVSRWDGASWTQLGGGVIDDSPYIGSALYEADMYRRQSWLPINERTYPGRPCIASDGETLYVAYSVHVATPVPDQPPLGSFVYGITPYGSTISPANLPVLMYSRQVMLRIYDAGADNFDVLSLIPAQTNNTMWDFNGGDGQLGGFSDQIALAASPAEPGVCYVALAEAGYLGYNPFYILNPHFFVGFVFGTTYYPRWQAYLRWIRFESGFGVGRNVVFVDTAGNKPPPWADPHISYSPNLFDYPQIGNIFSSTRTTNQSGTGYLLWGADTFAGGRFETVHPRKYFSRWDDMATIATFTPDATEEARIPGPIVRAWPTPVWSELRSLYYEQNGGQVNPPPWVIGEQAVRQIDLDLGVFQYLDNQADLITAPVALDRFNVLNVDDPDDLWAITRRYGSDVVPNTNDDYVWLYHRPCQGWVRILAAKDTSPQHTPFGRPAMVRIDDTLYVANGYFEFYNPPTGGRHLKIKVLEIPILRDAVSCGFQTEGVFMRPRILA